MLSGYAFYGKVCTSESMSIAEDKFNFLSIVTAAHELGHSLGGVHDGETDDANCRDEDGYILSSINAVYTDSKATHPWKFSPCSAAAFTTKLAELQASGNNCLRRDDTDPLLLPTGIPPGQMFPPDKQCKLMFDDESVMWRQRHDGAFDRMCTAMACTQLGLTKITFVIPGDGTTCGDKKWCWNGKCVYSEEAPPANDTCLHGDQTGAFISGSTCAETLAGDNIWKCYQANIEQTCCGTCAAGNTGLEGCEYGDVSDCSSISSAQCYNENIAKSSCCKTCYDFAKSYTNLPAECKYGDKKAGCDNSVATCTQFMSDCCASCTGFTMPSTSSTSTTTSSQTSATSDTTKKTTPTQDATTKTPVEQDGLPDWVLPVAAGAGGVLVLSILIGLCTYCMKQSSKKKYKSEEDRRHSGDRRRNTGENRRVSENERRRSEENRRTSDNNRRNERRRSEDTRTERRRASEDLRPPRNYNRRYSTPNGAYRY
ncbi:A disintegrin and metalloproteinase with thrombospondin motifs adt-2-like [Mercenaria mercenaria]|uniref:A disintegrin and metalloproteinase with thrombospondin motifs adt-2-like n=1 Tax=Mercenaria mercenaria TaxID=6596 RepID=UPI00234E9B7E|nr:A disintegrin and metalloproteinase with thrombospondin motifs adt-2-like [Mercenaria mercenaria]